MSRSGIGQSDTKWLKIEAIEMLGGGLDLLPPSLHSRD